MIEKYQNIITLILKGKSALSKWISFTGLAIGIMLLLTSLQLFIDINQLIKGNVSKKNGFDFISVTKIITNENMAADHTFSSSDIDSLRLQANIEDVGALTSNQFRVKANAGNLIPFSTDLFLESVPANFLDTLPDTFTWSPGQAVVPIIFSADFLEMYNVFAPAQGLPQLSSKTISSVNIGLACSGNGDAKNFQASIVGISDRINSILVPESFMKWANHHFNDHGNANPERIYIKTKDANNPALLNYLDAHGFHVNKDKTKFGRVKQILQSIVAGLAIFGILIILLAGLLFSFYLQLMIARSKEQLNLLVTLGYSPAWISRMVVKNWVPVYAAVITVSVLISGFLNFLFVDRFGRENSNLSFWPHPIVFILALILFFLSIFTNKKLVKDNLSRLSN